MDVVTEVEVVVKRDQVFICYSPQDEKWLQRLHIMLMPAIRQEAISIWDETKIQAGAKRNDEVEHALKAASVAVLLVSAHFLASDLIFYQQLTPLLEAAENEDLKIMWIYVSYCMYEETLIANYKEAHNLVKPLDSLSESDLNKVLLDICKKIKELASEQVSHIQQHKDKLKNLLNQGREVQSQSVNSEQTIKIDKNFLVEFDLTTLTDIFISELSLVNSQGIISFSLIGDRHILYEYIIERMKLDIKRNGKGVFFRKEYLDINRSNSKKANQLIENKIEDLIGDGTSSNILLFIWRSSEIPTKEIKSIVNSFCRSSFYQNKSQHLQKNDRCFVLTWGTENSSLRGVEGIFNLKIPKKIDNLYLFRKRLEQEFLMEINRKDLYKKCINCLEEQDGDFFGTYRELDNIIRTKPY